MVTLTGKWIFIDLVTYNHPGQRLVLQVYDIVHLQINEYAWTNWNFHQLTITFIIEKSHADIQNTVKNNFLFTQKFVLQYRSYSIQRPQHDGTLGDLNSDEQWGTKRSWGFFLLAKTRLKTCIASLELGLHQEQFAVIV